MKAQGDDQPSGDELLQMLAALSNPQRLRILGVLARGRTYVSQLARDVRLSRPLVHMHLRRLEGAGLVVGHLELSSDGKAMKFFEVRPFSLRLTPEIVGEAAETLTDGSEGEPKRERKEKDG